MTLVKDQNFYWPWPVLGIPLTEQWFRIRTDTELLKAIVDGVYYENTDGIRGHAALAGMDFGEQTFDNRYRVVYIAATNELFFQCNEGTEAVPVWADIFHLDCDGPSEFVVDGAATFEGDLTLVGDFYGSVIARITAKDGTRTFVSDTGTISFNGDQFYLTKDSDGNPEVNSKTSSGGISSITFSDGTHTFSDDTLKFNPNQFYLTQDSLGNPLLNSDNGITVTDGTDSFFDDLLKFNFNQFYLTKDSQGNPQVNSIPEPGPQGPPGVSTVTFDDGVRSISDDTLKFNPSQFYLSQDSLGNPLLNSLAAEASVSIITFTDGVHTFSDDTLKFNGSYFYLTSDSAGNPIVNAIPSVNLKDGIRELSEQRGISFNSEEFYISKGTNYPVINLAPQPEARSRVLVTKSSNQTLTDNAALVEVTWDVEAYDLGGWHNNSTNTSRITVPNGVNLIQLSWDIHFLTDNLTTPNTTTAFVTARLLKNGAAMVGPDFLNRIRQISSTNITVDVTCTTPPIKRLRRRLF